MADGIANFFMLVVTDVIVTVAVGNHLDVIWQMFFANVDDYGHIGWNVFKADLITLVADGKSHWVNLF